MKLSGAILPLNSILKLSIICFIVSLSQPTFAIDGMWANFGVGMDNFLIQNKSNIGATQKTLGAFWKTNFNMKNRFLGYAELEMEAYVSQIKNNGTVNIYAVRPVFSFWDSEQKQRNWYWQFGIGISRFDDRDITPIRLSSNEQFATIFGIGMPLDAQHKHRLTLRYNHYSNGFLKRPNQGVDILSLDWHFQF